MPTVITADVVSTYLIALVIFSSIGRYYDLPGAWYARDAGIPQRSIRHASNAGIA